MNSYIFNHKSPIVDLPRIELGTVQCECTGIPLTYKPETIVTKSSSRKSSSLLYDLITFDFMTSLWTRRESNPLLFHAMEACYRYTTGPFSCIIVAEKMCYCYWLTVNLKLLATADMGVD